MLKALWVEDLDGNQDRVVRHVKQIGATKIFIRTSTGTFLTAMPQLKQQGLKVYGWRWPHLVATPDEKSDLSYWKNEQTTVLNLIAHGLDGYVFDIESDDGINDADNNYRPYPHDWDNPQVPDKEQQANDFVTPIYKAFKTRGTPYILGLTSHQRGFSIYPDLPWQPFLNVCSVLYPQTYWRYRKDDGSCANEAAPPGGKATGKPAQAVINGYTDYANKKDAQGNVLPIIPVAGEIGCATGKDIQDFATAIAAHHSAEGHFYVDFDDPLEAIAKL